MAGLPARPGRPGGGALFWCYRTLLGTRRQVAAENGQVGRSTRNQLQGVGSIYPAMGRFVYILSTCQRGTHIRTRNWAGIKYPCPVRKYRFNGSRLGDQLPAHQAEASKSETKHRDRHSAVRNISSHKSVIELNGGPTGVQDRVSNITSNL